MRTNNNFIQSFLENLKLWKKGELSNPYLINSVVFGSLTVLYILIVALFFNTVFTGPAQIYAYVIFIVFAIVLLRMYRFLRICESEENIIYHISLSIKGVVEDLKNLRQDSSANSVAPQNGLRRVGEILAEHHEPSQNSLLTKVIQSIVMRSWSRTKLEIGEITSESIDPTFKSNQALLNTGASISIAIGLLGTFAGMLHSLNGKITISNLLAGLNEAIGSSLIGVLTAIFIIAYSKLYASWETALKDRFSQFVMCALFPSFQLETTVTIDDEAARIIGEKIGAALARQLEATFQELTTAIKMLAMGIQTVINKLTEHNSNLEKLVMHLSQVVKEWNAQIGKINQEITKMGKSLTDFAKELKGNKEIIKAANDEFIQIIERLDQTSRILRGDLNKWVKENPAVAIRDHIETLRSGADKLYDSVSRLDGTITGHMDIFITRAAEHWLPMERTMSQHANSLNEFVNRVLGIEKNLETMLRQFGSLKNQLQEITAQLDESESTRKKMDRIHRRLIKDIEKKVRNGELGVENGRIVVIE